MNKLKALLAAGLLVAAGTAQAATYYVDRTLGLGQVSGFIETDGTLGAIDFSNFVDYHLEITGPNFSYGSLGVIDKATSGSYLYGTGLTATAQDLLFDTTAPGVNFILWWTADYNHFWCLESGGCNTGFASETLGYTDVYQANTVARPGEFAFASVAAVPLPAALPMLMAALGGLAAMRRRRNKA